VLREYPAKGGGKGFSLDMNVSDVKLLGGKSAEDRPRPLPGTQPIDDDPSIPF
jgi:hypothetical protein